MSSRSLVVHISAPAIIIIVSQPDPSSTVTLGSSPETDIMLSMIDGSSVPGPVD